MTKSEDDLWRVFRGEDQNGPGKVCYPFHSFCHMLMDYESFRQYLTTDQSKNKSRREKEPIKKLALTDTTRFYLLVGRERQACVDQSRLIKVGKAMRDRELSVQYLGVLPAANDPG